MRIAIVSVLLLFAIPKAFAQKAVVIKATPITKAEFNTHIPVNNLIDKPQSKLKSRGIIRLKTDKKTVILKDDGEFLQYTHVGDLRDYPIVVIHEMEPNDERYLLISKRTGIITKLVNKPIFFTDKKNFICLEGSGTDMQQQRIQVGQIKGDTVITKMFIKLPVKPFIPLSYIFWYNEQTIFIATNSTKFPDTKLYKVRF